MDITEMTLGTYLFQNGVLELDSNDKERMQLRRQLTLEHEKAVYTAFIEQGWCHAIGCDGHEDLLADFRRVYRVENQGTRYVLLPLDYHLNPAVRYRPAKVVVAQILESRLKHPIGAKQIISIEPSAPGINQPAYWSIEFTYSVAFTKLYRDEVR